MDTLIEEKVHASYTHSLGRTSGKLSLFPVCAVRIGVRSWQLCTCILHCIFGDFYSAWCNLTSTTAQPREYIHNFFIQNFSKMFIQSFSFMVGSVSRRLESDAHTPHPYTQHVRCVKVTGGVWTVRNQIRVWINNEVLECSVYLSC